MFVKEYMVTDDQELVQDTTLPSQPHETVAVEPLPEQPDEQAENDESSFAHDNPPVLNSTARDVRTFP